MSLSADFLDDVALLREHLAGPGAEPEHGLSSSKVTCVVAADRINYQRLCSFAGHGNLVEVEVTSDSDYAAKFRADSRASFAPDDPSAAIDGLRSVIRGDHDYKATAAIEGGRFAELAAALPSPTIRIALTLREPPGGPAFVWSAAALFTVADSWVSLAHLLTLHSDLVLLDAGAMVITSPSLAIRGPDASDLPPRTAATVLVRSPWRLASPAHFLTIDSSDSTDDKEGLTSALSKLAAGVAWLRVSVPPPAVTAGPGLGKAQVAFSHDPTQCVDIGWMDLPFDSEAVKAAELWAWLDADGDAAGRLEAVRQAAATSVRSATDLRDGVSTVLRQARFMYELSRQRAVAAIVEARKSARLAAQTAAHTAAAEARSAARSTADRTVAAVIAALAVMITHHTSVLGRSVSYLVLAAVLVGIVASLAQAFAFEFPATKSALDATLLDLRVTQRDVLLDEDVVEFESGAAVGVARQTLGRAKAVSAVAGAIAFVAVVAGVLVVRSADQTTETPPSTATTVSSAPGTSVAQTTSASPATTGSSTPASAVATSTAATNAP